MSRSGLSGVVALGVVIWLLPAVAAADCPTILGFKDRNCDGRLRISVIGDSVVDGEGDEANGDRGGYVLRLAEQLPGAEIDGYGFSGITSAGLEKTFTRIRRGSSHQDWRLSIGTSDYVVIDAGRNDYVVHRSTGSVLSYLRTLASNIRQIGISVQGLAPLVVVSTLAHTSRSKQERFLRTLNSRIRRDATLHRLILGPQFDSVSGLQLNRDGLHPTAAGYDRLEFVIESFLRIEAQSVP